MKKFVCDLKRFRRTILPGALFASLEAGIELIAPIVLAAIIDRGVPSGSAGRVLALGFALAMLGTAGLACAVAAQYFFSKTAAGLGTKLRRDLLRRIQSLSYADLDRHGTPAFVALLTDDVDQLQSCATLGLRLLLRAPLTAFGALLAALLIGARANAGQFTQGEAAALLGYVILCTVEMIHLRRFIAAEADMAACRQRVRAMLATRPALRSPVKPEKPDPRDAGRVDFEHVCLRFPGSDAEQLRNINFSARRGQIIGVVGGAGAGKTALANLIPRFCDSTSGVVRVNGVDVRNQNLSALRARIGVVSQPPALFRGSIRDNLLWGDPAADDGALMEAVSAAQAEDILRAMGGLDAPVEPFGENLSDSQRHRLAIARALVRRPDILILDDHASALNFAADFRLRMAIRRLPYRPTVFITSRHAAAVRYADRILVLDGGRIAGSGTHEQLLERCPVYRDIFDSQLQKEEGA